MWTSTASWSNNVADEPVHIRYVKGIVIGQVSGLGTAVRVLKSPAVTILMVAVAFLTIELPYRNKKDETNEELERIKEEIRRLKEEQTD